MDEDIFWLINPEIESNTFSLIHLSSILGTKKNVVDFFLLLAPDSLTGRQLVGGGRMRAL